MATAWLLRLMFPTPRLTAHLLVVSYLFLVPLAPMDPMYTCFRLLGSTAIPLFLLLACISSAGIGTPPGVGDDASVGGDPGSVGGSPTGGDSATGLATGGAPATQPSQGGTRATGGMPALPTGGSPGVATGGTIGTATGGMSSIGTSGSCDFTNATCQNPCGSMQPWEQADCASYITCMQSNTACVKASDPICAAAGSYGAPTCTELYRLSGGTAALTTYMKCVCGFS